MDTLRSGYNITIAVGLVFCMYLGATMFGFEHYANYVLLVISVCGFLGAAEIARKASSLEREVLSAMLGLYSLAGFLLSFISVLGGT